MELDDSRELEILLGVPLIWELVRGISLCIEMHVESI